MKIFVMRHGEAEVIASSDEARHLNNYGRKQSISQGQWLKNHLNSTALSVQKVIVSPYVRAQETFELVNSALDNTLNDVGVGLHLMVMLRWWQIIYLSCKKKALKVFCSFLIYL